MKIECDRKRMVTCLQNLSFVVPQRTTKPILYNLFLKAESDRLVIKGTDLDLGTTSILKDVTIREEGEVLVPSREFMDILREGSTDTFILQTEKDAATVTFGGSFFRLMGCGTDEYPNVPSMEGSPDISISSEILRAMIRQTRFSCATEMTRYALNGVLFVLKEGLLELVATDGRRLARYQKKIEGYRGKTLEAIVPARGVQGIERILDENGTVSLKITESKIFARCGDIEMMSCLVEGRFPNYEAIIPKDLKTEMEMEVSQFVSAVRQAAILVSQEAPTVKLSLKEGLVEVSSRTADLGESKIEIPAAYHGEPVQISFNPNFLLDVLKALAADAVTLKIDGETSPAVFCEGEEYMYIVMPITNT